MNSNPAENDHGLNGPRAGLVALLFAMFLCGCAIMPKVIPIANVTQNNGPGVVYSLPKTLVAIDLPIKKTAHKPGDLLPANQVDWPAYADHLRTHLSIQPHEIILEAYDSYELVSAEIATSTLAVPDPKATFYAAFQVGFLQELKLDLTFSGRGLLTKADVSSTNQTLPLLGKVAEAVISFAGIPKILNNSPKALTYTPLASASSEVKDVIETINKIREKQDEIIFRQNLGNADVVKLALEHLKARETVLLARLVGSEITKVWVLRAEIDPPANSAVTTTLLKIHNGSGVEISSLGKNTDLCPFPRTTSPSARGRPRFDRAPPTTALPPLVFANSQTTDVVLDLTPKAPVFSHALIPTVSDGSLYYRVPGEATAVIRSTTPTATVHSQAEFVVAQHGSLQQLPRKLEGYSGGFVVTLDEATGGLKSLTATSKPIDTAAQFSTLAGKFIEKEKVDDEMASLERKKKKLDLEKSIRELEAATPTE